MQITPENVAKAVDGFVDRDGSILCLCPIHETGPGHTPSLALSITDTRRILVHCRSRGCDKKHFREIKQALASRGLPADRIGATRKPQEFPAWDYFTADGKYSWTKQKKVSASGRKRFICGRWDHQTNDWIELRRPADAVKLFNLPTITQALAAAPEHPLLIVEGEKDTITAAGLGALAVTNADGAGKWTAEDTRTLIALGARKVVICPDNDAPGIDHGVRVAKFFQSAGVETRWLELPGLGAKEDISDWAPNQADPAALLAELIDAAPLFDANALDWRSRLKTVRPNAGYAYRGDTHNLGLALRCEPRLKGCFAWNDFRHRIEVTRKTPWCLPEWWETTNLTPVGYRALRDADLTELNDYLVRAYDFGPSSTQTSRMAINATAEAHIFDELKSWLDRLPEWDGVARLDGWPAAYAGADTEAHATDYLALIGAKYVMQALNRALHPGAKADYSLVFTSIQGANKDRTLETMFSPYYREGVPSPRVSPADFARGIAGAIVAHGSEMSSWRKSDVEDQKAVLTRCVDHGRPAYGYETRYYPRRTCLAFSTNDVDFLRDATGDRRYWTVEIIRERVDIEALRRDRDQLLAEALQRLKGGEQHWPTPEEEERLIEPERQKFMPEATLEIIAVLERFIVEAPQTTRPNRGDFAWKSERRPQPLIEIYLDAFFEKCFGMYAAVKRQGLDRASKRDIDYCTTWLRRKGWRRVRSRLPDGQRVMVWRAPGGREPDASKTGTVGWPTAENGLEGAAATDCANSEREGDATGATGAEGVFEGRATRVDTHVGGENLEKISTNQLFNSWATQNDVHNECLGEVFSLAGEEEKNHPVIRLGKSLLGGPALEGLSPVALDRLDDAFPRDRFLALDIETTGLSAAFDRLRTVQLADGENIALVVFASPVAAHALIVLADFLRGRRVVVHNARFEAAWLRQAGIDLVLDDTALLFAAVRGTRSPRGESGGRVSLAALAVMTLDETLDKSEQTSDWAAPTLTASQLAYALNDAVVTHRIWEALRAELHRKSEELGLDIAAGYEDLRFSAAMARVMERAGIGFDVAAHQAWIARKREPAAAIEAHLAALDPALTPACIASSVQLDRLFRQRLEGYGAKDQRLALLAWPKTEKRRRLSFSREDLAAVLVKDRLPPAERRLIEALYGRAEQMRGLTTFGEAFASRVVDGRLYGQLHAGGAVTGRYTSTDPNLQNILTDPEFRGFFHASDGRVLVDVDYSQLELRVFAAVSGDAKMIAAFEAGWDYHDLIKQRLGCTRRQAKVVNFAILYGMSAATLAADLGVDEMTAGGYLREWDEQAPTGAQWRSERPRLYAVEQGVRTARRWIDYLDDDDADVAATTRPMNYPVQGSAADVMHRALRLSFERYRDWPGGVMPVLTVHDKILVEADAASAGQVGSVLADVMIEAFRDVLPHGPTRFLAIPGVGRTWAEAKADGGVREQALRERIINPEQGDAECSVTEATE
jgi:DNA polymerase I-like protein with 3'-5' exonuclease and polymerase domains/predicted P-loop ATPase